MTASVGHYGVGQYIKHAPPGATAPLANGRTYDAGTAQIIDSNISWLARESGRHLVSCTGFSVQTFASTAKAFEGIDGWTGHDTIDHAWDFIPWDRRTAIRLGPFHVIQDEIAATGELIPRKIVVQTDVSNAGSTLLTRFALTTSSSSEELYINGGIGLSGTSDRSTNGPTATGVAEYTLTPAMRLNERRQPWRCRQPTTTSDGYYYATEMYLWFGFRAIGGTVWVNSINAWETR